MALRVRPAIGRNPLPVAHLRAFASGALILVALTSCSAAPALDPEMFLGETLEEVSQQLGERDDLTQLTQDVSVAVGREPTFTEPDLESTLWTVVAACADADDVNEATVLEVAVIPTDTLTAAVARDVSDGVFADTVSCLFDE